MVSKRSAADSSSRQHTRIYHTTRAVIATSDETQQRIGPATHHNSPPQQAGRACLVLCVFSNELGCSENADSSSSNSTHVYIIRLGRSSQPQMKLSSVLGLLLIIIRRRSKRVGLVLSCVCFRTNSVVLKMLIQAPGNLPCFAVELGFS